MKVLITWLDGSVGQLADVQPSLSLKTNNYAIYKSNTIAGKTWIVNLAQVKMICELPDET